MSVFPRVTKKAISGVALSNFFGPLTLAGAQSPTVSTAAVPASTLDKQWQTASSKYDVKRAEILSRVDRRTPDFPYTDDWASLAKVPEPQWYKDAKFGIFIHWGIYSVPAFGSEWYPRRMYRQGNIEYEHHVATYGPLDIFGYKDFVPMFKAKQFDPAAWAHLFKESGARYVVPVFEHHDGFTMYASDLSDYTAVKMGPHRDVVGDLAKAIRAEGMHLGASSHRIEHHWFFANGRLEPSDLNDPKNAGCYGPAHPRLYTYNNGMLQVFTYITPKFMNDWLARSASLSRYRRPRLPVMLIATGSGPPHPKKTSCGRRCASPKLFSRGPAPSRSGM